jgi:DNA-binding transcriptional MerR regulator
MEYRVEQLAAACDVSVDTVRYYQSKGLLDPPRRAGRVAIYGRDHATRIRKIRTLQRRGLPLAVIARMLHGDIKRSDADLAEAVAAAHADGDEEQMLTLDQVGERSGVPTALLRAIEKAGLTIGRKVDGEERYSEADVAVVRQGLRLLEAGLPLNELIALGARYNESARALAEHAVALFDEHIRTPIRQNAPNEAEAAEKIVAAFGELLPAVTTLVSHHFKRVLLAVAEEHIQRTAPPARAKRKART